MTHSWRSTRTHDVDVFVREFCISGCGLLQHAAPTDPQLGALWREIGIAGEKSGKSQVHSVLQCNPPTLGPG
jgi:hypothetical protein